MSNKTKVLMVCLGNICRSPLAHGILEQKLDANLYTIDSAGTGAFHIGKQPDVRSITVAKKYGLDISNQRAQQFKARYFEEFDYIFVMDSSNYKNVIALASSENERKKVALILNEITPDLNNEVPDPYYGGDQGFENVYQMLEKACVSIAKRI